MNSYFYLGTELHQFMFKDGEIVTLQGFIVLCIGISCLCVLVEGLRIAQNNITLRMLRPNKRAAHISTVQALLSEHDGKSDARQSRRYIYLASGLLVHILQITIGYFIMLTVMSFNAYLLIAVILGSGVGYFFFSTFEAVLNSPSNRQLVSALSGGYPRVVCVSEDCTSNENIQGGGPSNENHQTEYNATVDDTEALLHNDVLDHENSNSQNIQVSVDVHS